MSDQTHIQYLTHPQIDKKKWDSRITSSSNGLIYACSFYLDAMSPGWDALVMGDYEIIMPLTWKKKLGIKYLCQPFLTAQLGVFGNISTPGLVETFIQSIPSSFKLIEISMNTSNKFLKYSNEVTGRNNYILDLNRPYSELYKNYRENNKRNSKKAAQAGCTIIKNIDVEKIIELATLQMKANNEKTGENIARFRKLFSILLQKKMAITYGVLSLEKKLLTSAAFFIFSNRAYYILVGNHRDAKTTGSSHFLIDGFIKDHAGTNLVLDFEGSDIESLANFYSGFGAILEIYPALKINNLPFYLKWLKR